MDDELDPKEEEGADGEIDDGFDDDLILGKPKKGRPQDDDSIESLDALADEEDVMLPEDGFDDEDLW